MLLSIITINYNNLAGLKRTHQSVKKQTCDDYEWIVIDGASTDGSAEYIQRHAADMAYHVSEPDTGIYNAMNKGVKAAKGNYLIFLNSGDEFYDTDVIRRFASRGGNEDVVYGKAMIVDADGKELWKWPLPAMPLRLSYFWSHSLKHQATFFSARCFERFMYNEEHRINSDTELFMTLLYHNYTFAAYDQYVTRFDGNGLSSKAEAREDMEREFDDTLRRLMPAGMIEDYKDVIMLRDVPLAQMAKSIIKSSRWLRNTARIALYPFYAIAKRKCK